MPFVTSKDGTRIGYSVVGSGPAIVLVDGALCSREMGPATPLAEELKDRFTGLDALPCRTADARVLAGAGLRIGVHIHPRHTEPLACQRVSG